MREITLPSKSVLEVRRELFDIVRDSNKVALYDQEVSYRDFAVRDLIHFGSFLYFERSSGGTSDQYEWHTEGVMTRYGMAYLRIRDDGITERYKTISSLDPHNIISKTIVSNFKGEDIKGKTKDEFIPKLDDRDPIVVAGFELIDGSVVWSTFEGNHRVAIAVLEHDLDAVPVQVAIVLPVLSGYAAVMATPEAVITAMPSVTMTMGGILGVNHGAPILKLISNREMLWLFDGKMAVATQYFGNVGGDVEKYPNSPPPPTREQAIDILLARGVDKVIIL